MLESDRLSMVCGALTHDIALMQDRQLEISSDRLSATQRSLVHRHSQEGSGLLKQSGVSDHIWLAAVDHHHERMDGTGYPDGLFGENIPVQARLVGLADTYTAMLRPRPHRQAKAATGVLRELYRTSGEALDGELIAHLIKTLGIYPTGTIVQLESRETGVIVAQGGDTTTPIVTVFMTPDRRVIAKPDYRDATRITSVLSGHRYRIHWHAITRCFHHHHRA